MKTGKRGKETNGTKRNATATIVISGEEGKVEDRFYFVC